jgi:hypothetical protein
MSQFNIVTTVVLVFNYLFSIVLCSDTGFLKKYIMTRKCCIFDILI